MQIFFKKNPVFIIANSLQTIFSLFAFKNGKSRSTKKSVLLAHLYFLTLIFLKLFLFSPQVHGQGRPLPRRRAAPGVHGGDRGGVEGAHRGGGAGRVRVHGGGQDGRGALQQAGQGAQQAPGQGHLTWSRSQDSGLVVVNDNAGVAVQSRFVKAFNNLLGCFLVLNHRTGTKKRNNYYSNTECVCYKLRVPYGNIRLSVALYPGGNIK